MIGTTVLAILENLGTPVQWLAIAGGAAIGALAAGLLAQMLCRWMTQRKLPYLPTTLVRGGGGVGLGLLTAMWVMQGGGWGPNGPGGPGGPTGPTPGDAKPDATKPPDKSVDHPAPPEPPPTPPDKETPTPPESVLRVEVLTDDTLRKLPGAGDQAVRETREYRLEGDEDPKNLHTLDEMQNLIRKRLGDNPPLLRLDIVLRPGVSPDKTAGRVKQLRDAVAVMAPKLTMEYPPR